MWFWKYCIWTQYLPLARQTVCLLNQTLLHNLFNFISRFPNVGEDTLWHKISQCLLNIRFWYLLTPWYKSVSYQDLKVRITYSNCILMIPWTWPFHKLCFLYKVLLHFHMTCPCVSRLYFNIHSLYFNTIELLMATSICHVTYKTLSLESLPLYLKQYS
jgi:hypothetical protein